jgi:microcystin-dependent protein
MSQPFVAQIVMTGFNFPPVGYAACNGQLLPISQYTAVFALVGTFYGGNGQSTFGLPNLQGLTPMFYGQGPGLSLYVQGQTGGQETHTLNSSEIPSHGHTATTLPSYSLNGNLKQPGGNIPAVVQGTLTNIYSNQAADTTNTGMFNLPGGAHNNMQPYLVVNFVIALQGIFPSRN